MCFIEEEIREQKFKYPSTVINSFSLWKWNWSIIKNVNKTPTTALKCEAEKNNPVAAPEEPLKGIGSIEQLISRRLMKHL